MKNVVLCVLLVAIGVTLGFVLPQDEVKAISPVPRFVQLEGEFVRVEVNDYTPDSVPEVILREGTVLEVNILGEDAPFGSGGISRTVLVRLLEHRVVTHAFRDTNGDFEKIVQYQGTSPRNRRGRLNGAPVFEYFTAEIVQ